MIYKKGDILKYNGSSERLNRNGVKLGTKVLVTEDYDSRENPYVQIKWLDKCSMFNGNYFDSSFDLVITRERIEQKKNRLKKGDEVVGKNKTITSIDGFTFDFFTPHYTRTISSIDYKNGWLILKGDENYDGDYKTNLPGLKFPIDMFTKYNPKEEEQDNTPEVDSKEEEVIEEQNTNQNKNNMEDQEQLMMMDNPGPEVRQEQMYEQTTGNDNSAMGIPLMRKEEIPRYQEQECVKYPSYEYSKDWQVTIGTLDNGFVVGVGCKSFAIESKERMLKLLNDYFTNPKETVSKFNNGTLFK